ncbi:hypothetical protein LTS18_011416, partial [Coniosporium uncinatum]
TVSSGPKLCNASVYAMSPSQSAGSDTNLHHTAIHVGGTRSSLNLRQPASTKLNAGPGDEQPWDPNSREGDDQPWDPNAGPVTHVHNTNTSINGWAMNHWHGQNASEEPWSGIVMAVDAGAGESVGYKSK